MYSNLPYGFFKRFVATSCYFGLCFESPRCLLIQFFKFFIFVLFQRSDAMQNLIHLHTVSACNIIEKYDVMKKPRPFSLCCIFPRIFELRQQKLVVSTNRCNLFRRGKNSFSFHFVIRYTTIDHLSPYRLE